MKDLLAEFSAKAAAQGKIFEAIVELTYRCNERCVHCYIPSAYPSPEVSVQHWQQAIDALVAQGMCILTLTGGEPLLYDGVLDLVAYAFRKGCQVRMFSNVLRLDSQEKLLVLKRAGLCYLETSLYGAKAETHDAITQVKGSFERTTQAIRWAVAAGLPVTVKTSWMKQNWREFPQIKALVQELNVYFRGSPDIMPQFGGTTDNLRTLMSFEELVAFYRLSDRDHQSLETAAPNKPDGHKPPCGIARLSVAIDPSGTMFPCMHLRLPLGNIFRDDLQTIWATSPLLSQIRTITTADFEGCAECQYRAFCFVCIGESWGANHSFTKPSSMTCVHARARYAAEHPDA